MSEISITDIPPAEINLLKGLSPTVENDNTIIYHNYSTPTFLGSENAFLFLYHLNSDYHIACQNTNRGTKAGRPNKCKQCKVEIEIGQPMIRLSKKEMIEYDYGYDKGERPIWRTWIFGNEECIRKYLEENDIEMML